MKISNDKNIPNENTNPKISNMVDLFHNECFSCNYAFHIGSSITITMTKIHCKQMNITTYIMLLCYNLI
jgi:hypothetical protein